MLEDLPELPKENVIGEPMGRDTANAVGYMAAVLKKRDPDAVCAVVTADHVIEPIADFQTSLKTAFDLTIDHPNALVTFGIVPTFGHTGLGYVHRGEALPMKSGGTAYKVLASAKSPTNPPPIATWNRADTTGTAACSSGAPIRCLNELAAHLARVLRGLDENLRRMGYAQSGSRR